MPRTSRQISVHMRVHPGLRSNLFIYGSKQEACAKYKAIPSRTSCDIVFIRVGKTDGQRTPTHPTHSIPTTSEQILNVAASFFKDYCTKSFLLEKTDSFHSLPKQLDYLLVKQNVRISKAARVGVTSL